MKLLQLVFVLVCGTPGVVFGEGTFGKAIDVERNDDDEIDVERNDDDKATRELRQEGQIFQPTASFAPEVAGPVPISFPPTGKVRIRVKSTDRYLHDHTSELFVTDRLISTRYQPPLTSTKIQFQFYPQLGGTYKIRTVGSGRYWREDPVDELISTRVDLDDDYAKFYVEEYCDGTVRFKVKATGEYLHVNEGGDRLCSTRWQPGAADKDTRFIIEYVNLADYLPTDWAAPAMEIESKWRISPGTYNAIVSDLPDGDTYTIDGVTYDLNVRWDGISRKYVDYYYDNDDEVLSSAGHSYRVRTRSTSSPLAASNDVADLQAATWADDWQKVQYKSTAERIDAIWFRDEYGDCRVFGGSPACGMTLATILDGSASHAANAAVLAEHPSYDFSTFGVTSIVKDYRYRVEFLDPTSGDEVFELSLDRVFTKTADDGFTSTKSSYEAEVEIVQDTVGLAELEMLAAIVKQFENTYPLYAATVSKGGVYVDNALIPGSPSTCKKVPLTLAVAEKVKFELP